MMFPNYWKPFSPKKLESKTRIVCDFWKHFMRSVHRGDYVTTEHGSITYAVFLESVVSIPLPLPSPSLLSYPSPFPSTSVTFSPFPRYLFPPPPSPLSSPLPGSESFWTQSLPLPGEPEAEKLGERLSTWGLMSQPWGGSQWMFWNQCPPLLPHTLFNMDSSQFTVERSRWWFPLPYMSSCFTAIMYGYVRCPMYLCVHTYRQAYISLH